MFYQHSSRQHSSRQHGASQQGVRQAPPAREALIFHAMFLAPTVVIAALAALELAVQLWGLLA